MNDKKTPFSLSLILALAAGASHAAPPRTLLPYVPAEERAAATGPVPGLDDAAPDAGRDPARPKHYGAAAAEILGFQVLLNRIDHRWVKPDDYDVSVGSVRRNLHHSWVEDRDPFEINQIGHPYQGSVYFNLARVNGLSFWESLGYSFGGSAVWEVAGETTPPSRNDQITTSFGGGFLGEAFFRMANLVLERGYGPTTPWREAGTALVSPSLAYKRHVRGGANSGIWPSHDPAVYARLQLGASGTAHGIVGPSKAPSRDEMAADLLVEYGLPGKPGYEYRRPFDYFDFRLRLSNVQGVESIGTRGMLYGAPYGSGGNVRGIAGIYGSYDYLSPQLFRLASTGLTLGSNVQWWLADGVALQGHASGGIGYTSTGTVRASSSGQYNYGFAPQTMLTLRLILGDKLAFDVNTRAFFAGKVTAPETDGTDRVLRGEAALTYRLHRHHALALKYITSRRKFSFPAVAEGNQRRDSIGLYYTYQPATGFGAISW